MQLLNSGYNHKKFFIEYNEIYFHHKETTVLNETAFLFKWRVKAYICIRIYAWFMLLFYIFRSQSLHQVDLFTTVVLKALVSGFSLPGKSCTSWQLENNLPGNEKPLTADQACWYLNERFFILWGILYGIRKPHPNFS